MYLRLCLLVSLLFSASLARANATGPELGLQSWTCRNMTFEQVIAFAEQHGIKKLQLIAAHLNPLADPAETLRKKAILAEHGLTAYSFGVNKTSLDKEANRKLFEFARLMDIKVIIVEPGDMKIWDNLEELVKEYDIKLAIHNHGTGTTYGDPATVKHILATRDHRIGVCLDIGWITAAGFDAAETFLNYGDRVYDLHFKDKQVTVAEDGKRVPIDTEIGKGGANYQGLFAAIKKTGWTGVMAIETDSKAFAENPSRLVSEAKTFFAAQTSGNK